MINKLKNIIALIFKNIFLFFILIFFLAIFSSFLMSGAITNIFDAIKFAFIGFMLFGIILGFFLENADKNELKDYCKMNKLDFQDNAPSDFTGSYFKLISKRQAYLDMIYNFVSGNHRGFDFIIADFAYHTSSAGSGLVTSKPSMTVHHNTFCVLSNQRLQMPFFHLRKRMNSNEAPYTITTNDDLNSLANNYPYADVDLTQANKSFSEKFSVAAINKDDIKKFFSNKICQIFLDNNIPNCFIEGNEQTMVLLIPCELELKGKIKFLDKCTSLFTAICLSENNKNSSAD